MLMHNSKIFYVLILIVVFGFSVNVLNKEGLSTLDESKRYLYNLPAETVSSEEIIPLIFNLNK
jgi:hypothetical protein